FAVTNAGVAVVPTAIVTTGTVVTLTVPAIAATAADQSVVYSVSYKGATAVAAPAFTVTKLAVLAVSSVSAINGTVTVTMNSAPATAPVLADFAVTNAGVAVVPTAIVTTGTVVTLTVPAIAATAADQSVVYSVSYKGATAVAAPAFTVTPAGFTFKTVLDALTGNTIVNVTVTDSNVTGVTVQGLVANNIGSQVWRASLPGTGTIIPVSASDITLTTSTTPTPAGFTFKTVLDALTGNTIVNVTATDSNVTGVTVQGLVANNIGSQVWRASLPGTGTIIPVSASDITLTTSTTPVAVNAIDMTKTVATKELFNDVFYQVYLLSGVTPSSVMSVTVTDVTGTTVLPYITANGNYNVDIPYTGTLPTSVSVAVTTAAGTQTVTVPVTN
ncbi:MAG: hypothetical protein P4L59_05340, partial [Desulfosporosinus sp.]|nr:hypothetical protein [Desulfosporosinus sp.]